MAHPCLLHLHLQPHDNHHRIKENELLEQIASLDDELRFSKGDDDGEASIAGCVLRALPWCWC